MNPLSQNEKQLIILKFDMSDFFDQSHDYQMVKTTELWKYREFDRMLTPKSGNEHDHLKQIRRFILKNGFQEPLIISCDLTTDQAYVSEGTHGLWVANQRGNSFCAMPCNPSLAATQWLL